MHQTINDEIRLNSSSQTMYILHYGGKSQQNIINNLNDNLKMLSLLEIIFGWGE